MSHIKVADLLVGRGDLEGGLAAYREAQHWLARADAADRLSARDLAMCLIKIGDVLAKRGNAAPAREAYGEAVDIQRRLGARGPAEAAWGHDLSASLIKLGDMLTLGGDLGGAAAAYRGAGVER
jgi:hypothetical protein